jgi:hypothetical protein
MRRPHHVGRVDETPRPLLWSATLAALLALISGCSDDPRGESDLVPVQDARGLTTYRFKNEIPQPDAAPAPDFVPARQMPDVDAIRREVEENHRRRQEQEQMDRERREGQEEQSRQEAAGRNRRELDRQKGRSRWEQENDLYRQRREQMTREADERIKRMIDEQTRVRLQMQRP